MRDYAAVAERIVQQGKQGGADDVVANVHLNRSYQIRFAQNEPVISNQWREASAFVGLVVQKRVVATQIKDLDRVDEQVESLVALARKSRENPHYGGIAEGPFAYAEGRVDKRILQLEEGGDYVEAAIQAALAEGATETAGSFWKYDHEGFLHTSNGAVGHDRQAGLYISLRALAGPESSGHGVACATRMDDFTPEEAGRQAGEFAALAKEPKSGEAGTYDVLFEPLIAASLIREIGGKASAFAVLAGLSPLVQKLGEQVASEAVTLSDDGSADSLNRRLFDDEGVPTRRNPLIEAGTLRTYLHNTSTAKLFETETTGNAGLIAPEAHALFLEPGDHSKEELLETLGEGLWLTNTWYTRYQSYVTGDFSTIPRDGIFRVRDGEVVEAWKDIRLTDNLLNLWKSVEAVGKEVQQMEWWYEVPHPVFAPRFVSRQLGVTRSAM